MSQLSSESPVLDACASAANRTLRTCAFLPKQVCVFVLLLPKQPCAFAAKATLRICAYALLCCHTSLQTTAVLHDLLQQCADLLRVQNLQFCL